MTPARSSPSGPRSPRLGVLLLIGTIATGCHHDAENVPQSKPSPAPAAVKPAVVAPSAPKADNVPQALADFNRGAALLEQYKYAEAAQAFGKVVSAFPSWTAARVNLGLALLNMQDEGGAGDALKRAEKEFLQILKAEPDNRWAHFCLGVYYQHISENDKALVHFEQVHKSDPLDPFVAFKYAEILTSLGRLDDAIPVLEDVVQRDPGFISAYYQLGNLYNRTRQREKATPLFQRFKELKPQELAVGSYGVSAPYAAMGKYYMALGADGLPLKPAPMSPAPRVLFAPEVRKLDVPLHDWTWSGGAVKVPGMAVGDIDGDGDLDIVLCGAGEQGGTVVLLNDGQGHFTVGAKLADKGVVPCLGDIDNDGDLDLWVGGAGTDQLFLNDGKGKFTPAPGRPPTRRPR